MIAIRIAVGDVSLDGQLDDTEGGSALAAALPLEAEFRVWGDALHFSVPVALDSRDHDAVAVGSGDLGLWADGNTLCIFFGPTPLSPQEEPVAAVPVTLVGRVEQPEQLRAVKEAEEITVEASD